MATQGGGVHRSTTLTFRAIEDRFHRIEDVQEALRQQGLESSQLVFGIDFTKVRVVEGELLMDVSLRLPVPGCSGAGKQAEGCLFE